MYSNFLVISFAGYKKYIICLTSFTKFSDFLPAFICASAVGNLWSISLDVNILRPFHILLCIWFQIAKENNL